MLGKKHQVIANWLVDDWKNDNRRVCVIEGFSGVGKTEVASEFERRAPIDARVDAPESGEIDDLMLDLAEQLAVQGHEELSNAINDGSKTTEAALESVLLKPVRIVIDEFQRMIDVSAGTPSHRIAAFLERVSKRSAPGRLLLLSHHGLDKTRRWGERVVFKTLEGLSPGEGAQLLGELLANRERESDIPAERRPEISSWLGGNPRAMRVLVGCLEEAALDDLTGVVPEAWEARDQQVSQGLISKLERELLVRALENLDGASASTLERVAVYRKAVTKDGVDRMLVPGLASDKFLAALSSRFLLEQRAGWYTLNPVVREISLHRLKGNTRATQLAHRSAAGFYTRHFSAKQIVNAGKLGGAFIEARYHLVQADEMEELTDIAQRFGAHLRALFGWTTPMTRDEALRDEIIGVLSAYLHEDGPRAMEYHLARLLFVRSRPGDHQRALDHVRKSTGQQSPADAWVLRLRLEAEIAGIDSMLHATRLALATVPADANLGTVYQMAAEQLALAGRIPEAIDLIEQGISRIAPDKGLYSLYIAEANLLVAAGEIDDAILLLRQGLTTIPADQNLFAIYVRAAQLLIIRHRMDDAVALLKDGITRISPNKGLYVLFVALADIFADAGSRDEAIGTLDEGLQKISTGSERDILQAALCRISDVQAPTDGSDPSGSVDKLISMPESLPEDVVDNSAPERRLLRILAVGTEWESRHGGLSTFNRDLCIELAAAGHRVVCVVPEAQAHERTDAERSGVCLVNPPATPGINDMQKLLLEMSLPEDFRPEVVIGHDRKTGPHANVLAQRFEAAKFIWFLHTRPENIEWHKDNFGPGDTATTAENRRLLLQDLAANAALVVGVGPALATNGQTLVYLATPQPAVHRLDPGFRAVQRPSSLPPEINCLVLGRAEDFTLKGLDIAACALSEVTKRGKLDSLPRLIVRGAPVGTGRELRERLIALSGNFDVEVRDYSPDVGLLQRDILMASLVLMPSRSEGFGLVALEAIAAGTPVLVSSQSGLALLLRERLGKDANTVIVETRDDLAWSTREWERSIEAVLFDRQAAFARAKSLREKLANILDWRDAIRQLETAWEPLLTESSQGR
ncbi:glycosyltransferase [Burkholderia sp. BKH01]|uniref:glycosyltransferase n=1 Tax=Burkholderia sp. BKH01 TaxID=2769262 RepID=UPI0021E04880|nr:glycosyltransferase [Burkholderia sp. BKH01]MCU9952603.1 glycosyltransferase [Burkholderia sp. BKH01]